MKMEYKIGGQKNPNEKGQENECLLCLGTSVARDKAEKNICHTPFDDLLSCYETTQSSLTTSENKEGASQHKVRPGRSWVKKWAVSGVFL